MKLPWLRYVAVFLVGLAFGWSHEVRNRECSVSRRLDRAVVKFEGYEFAVRSEKKR